MLKSVNVIFLVLSMFSVLGTATAASEVSVVPSNQNITPNGTFSIAITVDSGSSELQSAHIELNYNTNVLTANTLTPGTLLGTGVLEEPGSGITPGKVKYGAARTSTNPAQAVNGTFITVQFQANGSAPSGISTLDLANVELMKSDKDSIPNPQVNDGQVNIVSQSGNNTWAGGTNIATTPVEDKNTASSVETTSVPGTSGFDAILMLLALMAVFCISCSLARRNK